MQKYTAIILSSRDANEFDRVYVIYTFEQGLVRAVAKGVRKSAAKLAGHLEPGTLSEVYIARSRGRGQITSAITLHGFENVKKDFERLREALQIFSFLTKFFSEEEKDERIFSLLRDFLVLLNEKRLKDSKEILAEAFWWKIFEFLGHRPEVIKCTACKKSLTENSRKFFSIEKGGAVCAVCSQGFKELFSISDNQIKLLRVFWGNSLGKIAKVKVSRKELEKLERIRENYAKYHFG